MFTFWLIFFNWFFLSLSFSFFFFFLVPGVKTHGLEYARYALSQGWLSDAFYFYLVLQSFPGWTQSCDSPASASWIANSTTICFHGVTFFSKEWGLGQASPFAPSYKPTWHSLLNRWLSFHRIIFCALVKNQSVTVCAFLDRNVIKPIKEIRKNSCLCVLSPWT